MKRKTIDIITLGCSKNLVDSEHLMRQLEEVGFHVTHDAERPKGQIAVINTCGFIGDAKEESINMILEFAQGLGNSAEVGLAAHLLQADGVLYKVVGTPCAAVCIQIASRPRQSWDYIQRFPCWVAALGKNFRPQMPGHAADILHQAHRVGKGVGVDTL